VAAAVGIVVGTLVAVVVPARYAPMAGWDAAAVVFLLWTWGTAWPQDAADTAFLARREDPSRLAADIVVLAAAVVSLLAVALVIFGASQSKGPAEIARVAFGVVSVVLSWGVVHSTFCLRYARLYYADPVGGVNFNDDEPPSYRDFAYLAFTIGMTFQVSDTALQARIFRTTALRHALISFMFGTVIVAITINLVAGLSK